MKIFWTSTHLAFVARAAEQAIAKEMNKIRPSRQRGLNARQGRSCIFDYSYFNPRTIGVTGDIYISGSGKSGNQAVRYPLESSSSLSGDWCPPCPIPQESNPLNAEIHRGLQTKHQPPEQILPLACSFVKLNIFDFS